MNARLLPSFAKRAPARKPYADDMKNRLFPNSGRRRPECSAPSASRVVAAPFQPVTVRSAVSHVLVAIDFSDSAKAALEQARTLAEKFHAEITLLNVVEPFFYQDDLQVGSDLEELNARRARAQKEKLEILCQSELDLATPSNVIVAEGTAWSRIVETAKSRKADLIVIGTRGLTGLKHALLGSTAERVVRHAGCPVLVVHAPN
jgi:nucleotide-binding universal stress UspA family protein